MIRFSSDKTGRRRYFDKIKEVVRTGMTGDMMRKFLPKWMDGHLEPSFRLKLERPDHLLRSPSLHGLLVFEFQRFWKDTSTELPFRRYWKTATVSFPIWTFAEGVWNRTDTTPASYGNAHSLPKRIFGQSVRRHIMWFQPIAELYSRCQPIPYYRSNGFWNPNRPIKQDKEQSWKQISVIFNFIFYSENQINWTTTEQTDINFCASFAIRGLFWGDI